LPIRDENSDPDESWSVLSDLKLRIAPEETLKAFASVAESFTR
jgi:hypothetical protein